MDDTLKEKGTFRMAYFEMDSVVNQFELVKKIKSELAKKEEEINREIDDLARRLQQKYVFYQNQLKEGKLTEAQFNEASKELKKMEEEIKNRKQQLDQEYFELKARKENDVKAKIEAFLKDYNKTKNYSYIISYEQGLFYFKDTAYNITADVVKGLNELYKTAGKIKQENRP
ncbi:MAG: OmpH family outer membrane protein [Chitinophagaceae bacterium]|nr:OmpH family outer membrane protein [Chitinophagaceae bacterium]